MLRAGLAAMAAAASVNGIAAETANGDEELRRVLADVAALRQKLGAKAGEPEEPDVFQPVPRDGRVLTAAEARRAFLPALPKLEKLRWWQRGLDPTKLAHALREPAAVVGGCSAVYCARLAGAERALALAREAADFLLWAQAEAGTGCFPFPAARGGEGGRPFAAAEKFLARAERAGKLDSVVRNGWVVDDGDDGGLQFDNGEAGIALLELHAATGEAKYLAAARRAADWAVRRPIVRNWNYNSFSVALLARVYAQTGEPAYLVAAKRKARVGMLPGQLLDGPRAGRWVDAHNARPAYHYIMMRALADLAAVLPPDDGFRPEVVRALELGLRARNQDLLGPGAATKDKAMEALLLTRRVFHDDGEFLARTLTTSALQSLSVLVSEQFRHGRDPLGPREWGLFLASIADTKGSGR